MGFTTLTDQKTFLGISSTDTTQDTVLEQIIDGCSAAIETFLDRKLSLEERVDYLDGNGQPRIPLPQYPVGEVASVYLDAIGYYGDGTSPFASTTLLTAGSDYVLKRDDRQQSKQGWLVRLTGTNYMGSELAWLLDDSAWTRTSGVLSARRRPSWPYGRGNIKVTYTSGYQTIPEDLALATRLLVAWIRTSRQFGTMPNSESYEEYSFSLSSASMKPGDWPPQVLMLLTRYKRLGL